MSEGIIAHCTALAALLYGVACGAPAQAERLDINSARSEVTIRTGSSGLFSFLGHKHTIAAPIASGQVDTGEDPAVTVSFDSAKLQVLDPDLSQEKRSEVQKTMQSKVLDVQRYPRIQFRSREIRATGAGRWSVVGDLELHGVTREIVVQVERANGRYRGEAVFRQTDFGMERISFAGGAVSVKDEVRVEFDIDVAEALQHE